MHDTQAYQVVPNVVAGQVVKGVAFPSLTSVGTFLLRGAVAVRRILLPVVVFDS